MSSNTSSSSSSKANLSGALSSLNIGGGNESNNDKQKAANVEIINTATICAACGKEGDGDSMNTCNKCDLVYYCNAACKKKHRHKHKKKCERRVAELYDKELFKEPPPPEDCPICFLPLSYELPSEDGAVVFQSCCGKDICNGCIYAMDEINGANLCAFCRTPDAKSAKEIIERLEKLTEKGNADAYNQLAGDYADGEMGLSQDRQKANELYLKAGKLGCASAYFNLGNAYDHGEGVEVDEEKAKHYWELAAVNGNVNARYNLGCVEEDAGNNQRAMKHFLISARVGDKDSLDKVTSGFRSGIITKDEYEEALRTYHNSQLEMKSDARDEATAFNETRGIG